MTKRRWVPPLAVGLILLVDRRIWTDDIPLPVKAAADESAHIATTLCLLPLIRPKRPRDFFAGAIVGSVALDVDHLPLYAMYEKPSARPVRTRWSPSRLQRALPQEAQDENEGSCKECRSGSRAISFEIS